MHRHACPLALALLAASLLQPATYVTCCHPSRELGVAMIYISRFWGQRSGKWSNPRNHRDQDFASPTPESETQKTIKIWQAKKSSSCPLAGVRGRREAKNKGAMVFFSRHCPFLSHPLPRHMEPTFCTCQNDKAQRHYGDGNRFCNLSAFARALLETWCVEKSLHGSHGNLSHHES